MKITRAEFIGSFTKMNQLPKRRLPEIAFAGRSNVGKSSLLNRLVGRKGLAKTSGTPGKTRHLNYFLINNAYHFVDLPGYGFARVSRSERESWRRLIERFITENDALRCVVSIIDSRHGPTASDLELIEWLGHLRAPCLIVATKVDKLNRKQLTEARKRITTAVEGRPVAGPVFFSAPKGDGKIDVLRSLSTFLEN